MYLIDIYVTGTLPHGVLQQLRQDVVQRQWNEGKAGRHMAIYANPWRIPILMLTETSAGNKGDQDIHITIQVWTDLLMLYYHSKK